MLRPPFLLYQCERVELKTVELSLLNHVWLTCDSRSPTLMTKLIVNRLHN